MRKPQTEYKIIRHISPKTKDKCIAVIRKYFPSVEELIDKYANEWNIDKGDLAAETIVSVILPEIQKMEK